MRNLKSIALTAALVLTGAAFAVTSTPSDYNTATASTTATGGFGETVAFNIPSATFTIDAALLKPGTTYTITIPVTNSTSNRTMNISSGFTSTSTLLSSLYSLTATTGSLANLAAAAKGDIVYSLVVSTSATPTDFAGKALSFTFDLDAIGAN